MKFIPFIKRIKDIKYITKKKRILFVGSALLACIFLVVGVVLSVNKPKASKQQSTPQQTVSKNAYKEDSSIVPNSLYSIRLRDNPSHPDREVIVPIYHITFSVPQQLSTGQELHSSIHDENNAQTVVRLYKKDTKYTKDTNGYDVPDNTIIFSFDNPYGVDPIFGASEYVVGKPKYPDTYRTLLTDKLDFTSSMLKERIVSLYRYPDAQHIRYNKKTTDTFKGNVRMDLLTLDHVNPTIGVVYSCYDQTSKDSDLCEKTFQLFVSSVRLAEGELKDPPPTYAENDVWESLAFAKRNFDLNQAINTYQNNQLVPVSYYSLVKSQDLLLLWDDTKLRNMKCVPDQIFYRGNSYFEIANLGGDSPYAPIDLKDQNLLKILQTLQARTPEGYVVSQFVTCLTDDKRYIVKYNEVPKEQQSSGVNKDAIAYAKIVVIDATWQVDPIVDIPNKTAVCNRFLALTNDNILYFECRFKIPEEQNYGSNIYKIDLSKKSFSLLSTCKIPYESKGRDPKSFCNI